MNERRQEIIIVLGVIAAILIIFINLIGTTKTFHLQVNFKDSMPREINVQGYNPDNKIIYNYTGKETNLTITSKQDIVKLKVNSDYQKEQTIEVTDENQITLENKDYNYVIFTSKENYLNTNETITEFEKQKISEKYNITTILLNSNDYSKEIKEKIKEIKPKYALLIASEKTIPQQQKTNPLQNSPDSEQFQGILTTDWITYSDSDYGVINPNNKFTPETIIGRIPFDDSIQVKTYFENLKTRKTINQNDNIKSNDLKNSYSFLKTNQISPPIQAYDENNNKINTYDNQIKKTFQENNVAYIVLHGNEPETTEQQFIGKQELDGPEVITFDSNNIPEKTKAIIITDACYAAKLEWQQSVTKTLLLKGSPAFLGPTTSALAEIQYDKTKQVDSGSNKLLEEIKNNLEKGMTLGESLSKARQTLDYTNEVNQLTSLQFVIYGDPTIKLN